MLVARSPRERWRGLRPRPQGTGLLLEARSVHSRGMEEPLRVASLDAAGRVRRTGLLMPGRLWTDRGARWIIELPRHRPAPPAGEPLSAWRRRPPPILAPWPER